MSSAITGVFHTPTGSSISAFQILDNHANAKAMFLDDGPVIDPMVITSLLTNITVVDTVDTTFITSPTTNITVVDTVDTTFITSPTTNITVIGSAFNSSSTTNILLN